MSRSLSWYARRLRRMSVGEVAGRVADHARQAAWARQRVAPGAVAPLPAGVLGTRTLATPLPPGTRELIAPEARVRVLAAADRILAGEWSLLGSPRPDIANPDWFFDLATGRRAPQDRYAFLIDHRDEDVTGNVKNLWELSRHHHLTVLASAWWLTGDERYAEAVAAQLRSWWAANPFLSGIHWTSGIELGVRLISWVWVRRLLDEWHGVDELFGDDAVRQLWWHQRYLAAFVSRGSSANNHLIAEQAGLLAAACALPWYAESARWRASAARTLEQALADNTFASGLNRELATDYHRFVAELGLVAAAEADAARAPLDEETWRLLVRALDVAAALPDRSGRPPRQGDGDEGRALLLDDPEDEPWTGLLAAGDAVVGRLPWWPAGRPTVMATLLGGLAPGRATTTDRPQQPPQVLADAGLAVLRTPPEAGPEIWCRCDGGPHGFDSLAAHGHADALSIEVRHGGVDVLIDPGTYCYHGEPAWRAYFRSTLAHNTVEVDGLDQSVAGGPFLWERHAHAEVDAVQLGERQLWAAHHDGYARLDDPVRHDRTVVLQGRSLSVTDRLSAPGGAPHKVRLAYHLGPEVDVVLHGATARLTWPGGAATLTLPTSLTWSAHRGEATPVLGWFSPRFGMREPIWSLIGEGALTVELELVSGIHFPASAERAVPPAMPDIASTRLAGAREE